MFQLPENCEGRKCPVKARDLLNKNNKEDTIIYLRAPGPTDLYRDKRVPENREDGWMEVRVWKFDYNNNTKDNYIPMKLKLVCLGGTIYVRLNCMWRRVSAIIEHKTESFVEIEILFQLQYFKCWEYDYMRWAS